MPYTNEHACRLKDPGKYPRFRRGTRKSRAGKIYSVIYGIIRPGKSEDQAYRYSKSTWSASEARAHCSRHGGKFEAARRTSATTQILRVFVSTINNIKSAYTHLKGD